jgi:hypothetical protein
MGKALLIMVLGTGLFVSMGYMSTQEGLVRTASQQAGYEEEVLAREIARSGFNVAMGIIRPYGANLLDAVNAVNGTAGVMSGSHQGGEYRVRARLLEGFTVEVIATGYFGGHWDGETYEDGARHVMADRYQVPVLMARRCSALRVQFIQSQAGYCSAIYLQRYPLGVTAANLPAPEMLFAASHNADYDTLTVNKYVDAGTQMNFFIGVDQNCSTRPGGASGPISTVRAYDVLSHVYRASDYDYVHQALELQVERLDDMSESPWALVEQHPDDNQRWRIGWEDIHNTSWLNRNTTNPRNSLYALKEFGYDTNGDGRGDGWTQRDSYGYRLLRDGSLDLSDQVVQVQLQYVNPSTSGGVCQTALASTTTSGGGGGTTSGGTTSGGTTSGGTTSGGTTSGGTTSGGTTSGGTTSTSPVGCACPQGGNDKKVAVMHRPPGNEANEHVICVSRNGARTHLRQHNDYEICEGN